MPSALLIIDLQQAILQPEPPPEFDAVMARISGLIARAKATGAPVVWVQHNEPGGAWERGSATWQWLETIAPQPGDWVLHKQSSDAFHHTDLDVQLRQRGVDHVVVCGWASEFCVDTTVRSAASHDYAVTLVADAHLTKDRPTLSAAQIKTHLNWLLPNLAVKRESSSARPAIKVTPSAEIQFATG